MIVKEKGKQKDVLFSGENLSALTGWGSMLAFLEARGPDFPKKRRRG